MGCDIHTIKQVKKDGKWITKGNNVADEWRCYDSFAVLANVRNGYGFAGVKTGQGWDYISEPKGLPEDLELIDYDCTPCPPWNYDFDDENVETHTDTWLGDHSHSYHTLAEIEEFIETKLPKKYIKYGIVSRQEYQKMLEEHRTSPSMWCGGKCGANVLIVEEKDIAKTPNYTDVSMTWEVDVMDALGYLKNVVEELRRLAKEENVTHNDIRFVFGFDS